MAQGRLFVTNRRLSFHANIIGWVTNFSISYGDIVAVDKKNTAIVIPNAIAVSTLHQRFLFASFLWRDESLRVIREHWQAFLGLANGQTPLTVGRTLTQRKTVERMPSMPSHRLLANPEPSNTAQSNREDVRPTVSFLDGPNGRRLEPFKVHRALADMQLSRRLPLWHASLGITGDKLHRDWAHDCGIAIRYNGGVFESDARKVEEVTLELQSLYGSDHASRVLVRVDMTAVKARECIVKVACWAEPPQSHWFQQSITAAFDGWVTDGLRELQRLLLDPLAGGDSPTEQSEIMLPSDKDQLRRLAWVLLLAVMVPAVLAIGRYATHEWTFARDRQAFVDTDLGAVLRRSSEQERTQGAKLEAIVRKLQQHL